MIQQKVILRYININRIIVDNLLILEYYTLMSNNTDYKWVIIDRIGLTSPIKCKNFSEVDRKLKMMCDDVNIRDLNFEIIDKKEYEKRLTPTD